MYDILFNEMKSLNTLSWLIKNEKIEAVTFRKSYRQVRSWPGLYLKLMPQVYENVHCMGS